MSPITETTASRLLRSALTVQNPYQTTDEAVAWLRTVGEGGHLAVKQVPFGRLGEWALEADSGDLVHKSGKFFRVQGIEVETDLRSPRHWEQPIIDQPEIGILGVLAREIDGILYLLMQAKMEPGNPFGVQLTPTVQATRSNYTQVHQGTRPPYLDYFLDRDRSQILVDHLQWEQGTAFYRKRNRNIAVEVREDVPVQEGFRWLTVGQVRKLLAYPNLVSMDTRTVLACMPLVDRLKLSEHSLPESFALDVLRSFASPTSAKRDEQVMSWITDLKCRLQLDVRRIPLESLEGWYQTEYEIGHREGRFFKVIAVEVEADSREVMRWSQPLIAAVEEGLVALLTTKINGLLHVLVQARTEPGSTDKLMVGPTVQCSLGFETRGGGGEAHAFFDLIERAPADAIRYSVVQSEEGGRFYQVQNEYRIVELDDLGSQELPENFAWLTLRQLQELLRHGLVSVEARTLLACLSFT